MSGQALIRHSPNGVSIAAENMDPIELGQVLAASGFFQDSRDAAQAAVKVMAGAELGFGPVASMTGIYIVKGRVTLSANLMAAAIKAHPRYTYRVKKHTASECAIDFLENGEIIGTSAFSMGDARSAGLSGGENYKKHPRNMLFARALSNGAKWYCPDAFGGGPIYTPEELGVAVDGETGEILEPETLSPPPGETVPEPGLDELPPETISPDRYDQLLALHRRAGVDTKWLRMQLIAIGVEDLPDSAGAVNTAMRSLTPEQADRLAELYEKQAAAAQEFES